MRVRLNAGLQLALNRCPHCRRVRASLEQLKTFKTEDAFGHHWHWGVFKCNVCGSLVTARSDDGGRSYVEVFPDEQVIDELVPDRPRRSLREAMDTLHAPSASIMSSAAAIDSMLKDHDYQKGSLYERIEQAFSNHLLTKGMKEWAHVVRLEANAERHVDETYVDPTTADARRTFDFAIALAEILYILPERAKRGREEAEKGGGF